MTKRLKIHLNAQNPKENSAGMHISDENYIKNGTLKIVIEDLEKDRSGHASFDGF